MREPRHPIGRFNDLIGAREGAGHVALLDVCGGLTPRARCIEVAVELGEDRVAVEAVVRGAGPLDLHLAQRLRCPPVAIGDDGNRVVERHDPIDASHGFGRGGINRGDLGAEDRCPDDRGVLHARHVGVDAEGGRAVDLGGNVAAGHALAH